MVSDTQNGLKIALAILEISQIQIATNIGVHPSTMSRIVNGWQTPTEEVQRRILKTVRPHAQDFPFGWRLTANKQEAADA